MSVLLSKATGNWTDATATWGLVDSTSYLAAETGSEILTTLYSGTRSSAFTPGAITILGIAVKLSVRTGTTGTISVNLEKDSDDSQVAGTEVTINCSDLPVAATSDANGGWIYFKFAAPVTLAAATAYQVAAKTSSSSQVSLFRDGTADNISRALVTNTEQAPAAGDDVIITKSWTAAATGTNVTITMNNTTTTDYGSTPTAANSLLTPGVAVCQGGTLSVGTTAATNYVLKVSNSIIIYSGGTWQEGTTGTPIPRDSSFELIFDCGANVDYGFTARNLSTYIRQGLSRTSGKNIDRCHLNTDEAAAQTILGVDTDTGWLNGDTIGISSTSRTGSETESRTLSGNAGATTMTVSAGLTNAHSGTSPTQAEVVLLTRNVKMHGASASLQAYVDINPTATVDWDWAETYWMGSGTTNKRGIDIRTTTGTVNFNFCSIHSNAVTSCVGIITSTSANDFTLSDIVFYGIASGVSVNLQGTTGTSWSINNIIVMGQTGTSSPVLLNDAGGTVGNITICGNSATGTALSVTVGEYGANFGTMVVHSNGGGGIALNTVVGGTIADMKVWRNSGIGLATVTMHGCVVQAFTIFGNTTTNIQSAGSYAIFNNGVVAGDSTFSVTNGITFTSNSGDTLYFNSTTFGVASGIFVAHASRDILPVANESQNIVFNNCILASTEISSQTSMSRGQTFSSQKHDQTTGNHKQYRREGTLTIDTTAGMYDATPSARVTPTIANEEFHLTVGRVNLNSGQTATPSIKVRESVVGDGTDYNGNRIKLYVRQNDAIGITADTLLDTATISSEGAFETLTGTTAAASEDGVAEFYVTCDGTTGWINVDTLTVTVA